MGRNIGCENAPAEILRHIKTNFSAKSIPVDNLNIYKTNQNILEKSKNFSGIILGGDHSITYPAFLALAKKFKKCGLIILDAHVDCASYIKPPSHEDFARVLLEDKIVKEDRIMIMGVRKIYDVEKKYLKNKKIRIFDAKNALNCIKIIKDFEKLDAVYLSIDIDAFDPKIAMGTFYKEKEGLSKKEAFSMFKEIKKLKNLKIVDIVEANPRLDNKNKTIKLAAGIVDYFYG